MKQNFARQQHSRHQSRTPSVICLPPPPPVVETRPMAVVAEPAPPEPAMPLPENTEALVTAPPEGQAPSRPHGLSRQARRKALRAEAKALRRAGMAEISGPVADPVPGSAIEPAPEPVATAPEPVALEPVALEPVATALAPEAPPVMETMTPLPRERSLAVARPRGLALFVDRLRYAVGLRRTVRVPAETAIASQLRTLRDDLAAMQQSLDRLIEGVAA